MSDKLCTRSVSRACLAQSYFTDEIGGRDLREGLQHGRLGASVGRGASFTSGGCGVQAAALQPRPHGFCGRFRHRLCCDHTRTGTAWRARTPGGLWLTHPLQADGKPLWPQCKAGRHTIKTLKVTLANTPNGQHQLSSEVTHRLHSTPSLGVSCDRN